MKNLSGDNKSTISITFEEYDENHHIVFVEKDNIDFSFSLVLCEFQNWMDLFCNVLIKIEKYKDKVGFVFHKRDITTMEMRGEIMQFIYYYNLEKRS